METHFFAISIMSFPLSKKRQQQQREKNFIIMNEFFMQFCNIFSKVNFFLSAIGTNCLPQKKPVSLRFINLNKKNELLIWFETSILIRIIWGN